MKRYLAITYIYFLPNLLICVGTIFYLENRIIPRRNIPNNFDTVNQNKEGEKNIRRYSIWIFSQPNIQMHHKNSCDQYYYINRYGLTNKYFQWVSTNVKR